MSREEDVYSFIDFINRSCRLSGPCPNCSGWDSRKTDFETIYCFNCGDIDAYTKNLELDYEK